MKDYKVSVNEKFGYKMLTPVPTKEELDEYYSKKYYESMKEKNKQSLDRFINDNNDSKSELEWLENTEYEDAFLIFNKYFPSGELLDIGCGTGELLGYMKEKGFNVTGIEPSKIASEKGHNKGFNIHNCDLFSFSTDKKFDIINMTNVLEHIPNPDEVINKCKELLKKGGLIRIKVPNDFNELQLEAVKNLNKSEWWIAIPDHVNYFSFDSLTNLLRSENFDVINKLTDFPMELFLFMGDDYQSDKNLGKSCHNRRKNFELNISGDLRRKIYQSFEQIGLGRNIIVYAILK